MTAIANTSEVLPLLDALATGVVCLDERLRVQYMNMAAEQVFGVSARKTIGHRLTRLVTLPDQLFTRLRETLKNGQPYTDREVVLSTPSGETTTVDCSISPYHMNPLHPGLMLEFAAVDRPLRIARDEAMLIQQELSLIHI